MTRPGPPPQPTYLKLLRGNPGKQSINKDEPQPRVPTSPPEAPIFLTGYAKEEWDRIVPELIALRCLAVIDYSVLASYCVAYSVWRDAVELLAQIRERNPMTRGLMLRSHMSEPMENPVFHQMLKAKQQMLRCAAEFGLSPAARSRINAGAWGDPPRPSKFDGLIGPA